MGSSSYRWLTHAHSPSLCLSSPSRACGSSYASAAGDRKGRSVSSVTIASLPPIEAQHWKTSDRSLSLTALPCTIHYSLICAFLGPSSLPSFLHFLSFLPPSPFLFVHIDTHNYEIQSIYYIRYIACACMHELTTESSFLFLICC